MATLPVPPKPQNFLLGTLAVFLVLAVTHLLIYFLLENTASAADKTMFPVDRNEAAAWLDDYTNQQLFLTWVEDTLTKEQAESLAALMSPPPTNEETVAGLLSSIAILKKYGIDEDSVVIQELRKEIIKLPQPEVESLSNDAEENNSTRKRDAK